MNLDDLKLRDELFDAIYCNGGVKVTGWGCISFGYGGGVTQDQALMLINFDGFLSGLQRALNSGPEFWGIMHELNQRLLARYPNDPTLNAETVPFNVGPS